MQVISKLKGTDCCALINMNVTAQYSGFGSLASGFAESNFPWFVFHRNQICCLFFDKQ